MASFSNLLFLCIGAYFLRKFVKTFLLLKSMKGIPRRFILFSPVTLLGNIFPSSWSNRYHPGLDEAWTKRATRYKEFNSEILCFIPLLYGDIIVQVASPSILKTIYGDVTIWPKHPFATTLDMMGPNVLTQQGEGWRRHRKTVTPAFNNETHIDVWNVTTSLYYQMMNSNEWKSGDQHYFSSISTFTTRLALLVIAACGFNMRLQWDETGETEGLTNPIDATVVKVSGTLLERINFPGWVFNLPFQGLREIDTAWRDLEKWLTREVRARRNEIAKSGGGGGEEGLQDGNIFSRLITAGSEDSRGFTDEEIVGNLFIFFFAGHETTAWTLVVTLVQLALHQDEQEKVYQHITSVIGDREPTHEDFNELTPVLHCFYEALRLYPIVYIMLRTPSKDTVLTDPYLISSGESVVIPKDVIVEIDNIGASRNARLFPDAEEFNPSRWSSPISSQLVDNFFGFSAGPRVCIGKRFATFEAVCFLTLLLRDWNVEVKLERGETREEWEERVMKPELLGTMRIANKVPLQFTKRSGKA